jgi:hypothetical protein
VLLQVIGFFVDHDGVEEDEFEEFTEAAQLLRTKVGGRTTVWFLRRRD